MPRRLRNKIFPFIVAVLFFPAQAQPDRPQERQHIEVIEAMPAFVTAYTSSEDETDEDPWITASGERPGPGTVACPSRYPFGTKVEIEGIDYECEDRMASRYRGGNYFDVWHENRGEALEYGRKTIEVLVLVHEDYMFSMWRGTE